VTTIVLLLLIIGVWLAVIVCLQLQASRIAREARQEASDAAKEAAQAADLGRRILREIQKTQVDVASDLAESHVRADSVTNEAPGAAADAAAASPKRGGESCAD
jgi:predicted Holliday junction resolvase-like endonuclease